jgi:glutamate 5-kinase
MSAATPKLADFRRIVVKVGSSLLVDSAKGELRQEWLDALVDDLAERAAARVELLVVSSGAIAMGRNVLKLPKRRIAA